MFKILVVEDDKDLNKSVCSYLDKNGFESIGCLDATEAYDAMYENTFDMIISDIMMPEIDGFEFAENVRKLDNDIPIMFMTSRDDMTSKQKGFRIGIDDYMVKPIDMDEMVLPMTPPGGTVDQMIVKKKWADVSCFDTPALFLHIHHLRQFFQKIRQRLPQGHIVLLQRSYLLGVHAVGVGMDRHLVEVIGAPPL